MTTRWAGKWFGIHCMVLLHNILYSPFSVHLSPPFLSSLCLPPFSLLTSIILSSPSPSSFCVAPSLLPISFNSLQVKLICTAAVPITDLFLSSNLLSMDDSHESRQLVDDLSIIHVGHCSKGREGGREGGRKGGRKGGRERGRGR